MSLRLAPRELGDLEKLTVAELKVFLKERGVRSSGKKCQLLELAKLYYNSPVLRSNATELNTTERDIFANDALVWEKLDSSSQVTLPTSFSIDVVTSYLSTLPASLVAPGTSEIDLDGENVTEDMDGQVVVEVEAGTEKPSVKGRRMYVSEKLTMVEVAICGGQVLLRANCEASLRKSCRYPGVAISQEGSVLKGKCNCPAALGMYT
jgi:hypothetical protein